MSSRQRMPRARTSGDERQIVSNARRADDRDRSRVEQIATVDCRCDAITALDPCPYCGGDRTKIG